MMPCLRKSMKLVITDRILNDTDLTGQPQAQLCIYYELLRERKSRRYYCSTNLIVNYLCAV